MQNTQITQNARDADVQDAKIAQICTKRSYLAQNAHYLITAKIFIKSNQSSGIFRDSVYVLVLRLLMVHIHLHTNLTVGEIAFQTWMKPYSCAPQHFHASVCRLADILLSTEKN